MLEFEWDSEKAAATYDKHGVDFTEAASIFGDSLSITVYDPDHSDDEDRYVRVRASSHREPYQPW